MFREHVVRALRATGLLQLYDTAKFGACTLSAQNANRAFIAENPTLALPPLSLMYDAYGHVQYSVYHEGGQAHAAYIHGLATKVLGQPPTSILEWGCGPARVIRHMPLSPGHRVIGTDYNPDTIAWCRKAVPGIEFIENGLEPPLAIESRSVELVYALSVFTHLSEAMHKAWRDELFRVLRPGGILIATLHGDYYRERHLLDDEREAYDAGRLVVRGGVREGRKWFAAFHSPKYVRESFAGPFEVIEHLPSPLPNSIEQDIWVLRRPA